MKELKKSILAKIENSGLLIISLLDDKHHISTTLYCLEKKKNTWQKRYAAIKCVSGKNGWGWDFSLRSLLPQKPKPVYKKEGDGKTPAGVFALTQVYGKKEFLPTELMMRKIITHPSLVCVDDSLSVWYNKIVDENSVKKKYWRSAENMYRTDGLYDLGIIIDYNYTAPLAGLGSCIFMHIWRSNRKGTEGCTAMSKSSINKIISWLDEDKHPVLIQLPSAVYKKLNLFPELSL